MLLDHENPSIINDIQNKPFQINELYSFINFVVQDEEEQKIDFYARLFQLFILGKFETKYRTHILRSSRELKHGDMKLMRKIYLSEKLEFSRTTGPGMALSQVSALTQPNDSPIKMYSIQTLLRFGYLKEKTKAKPPWPTKLLHLLVENYYSAEELEGGFTNEDVPG